MIAVKILLSILIIFSMVTVFILLANYATHFKYAWLDNIADIVVAVYLIFFICFLDRFIH